MNGQKRDIRNICASFRYGVDTARKANFAEVLDAKPEVRDGSGLVQ